MISVFLDTGYVIALEAADDQHHAAAVPTKIPGKFAPFVDREVGQRAQEREDSSRSTYPRTFGIVHGSF